MKSPVQSTPTWPFIALAVLGLCGALAFLGLITWMLIEIGRLN